MICELSQASSNRPETFRVIFIMIFRFRFGSLFFSSNGRSNQPRTCIVNFFFSHMRFVWFSGYSRRNCQAIKWPVFFFSAQIQNRIEKSRHEINIFFVAAFCQLFSAFFPDLQQCIHSIYHINLNRIYSYFIVWLKMCVLFFFQFFLFCFFSISIKSNSRTPHNALF